MGIVFKPVVIFNEAPDYRIIVDGIEVGSVSLDEEKKVWKASRNSESDEPENFKTKEIGKGSRKAKAEVAASEQLSMPGLE